MKQLHALYFRPLPLAAHFGFFVRLSEILSKAGDAVKEALAALLPGFNARLAEEEAVMEWVRKSSLTRHIREADRNIGRLLVGINAVVKAALRASLPATKEAAGSVHIMLKNYGYVARKSYGEKAGDLQAVLEQFHDHYAAAVETLGLATWVQDLQTTFDRFEHLIRQRENEQAKKPACTGRGARKGLEDVYHQMTRIVNANALVGASDDFAAFINKLNPDIDHLNAEYHRVRKDVGKDGHTMVAAIPMQRYTGKPVTPMPEVRYLGAGDPVGLVLGKDFMVTYKNNVKAGTAEMTIHGKGAYKGRMTVTFNIEIVVNG